MQRLVVPHEVSSGQPSLLVSVPTQLSARLRVVLTLNRGGSTGVRSSLAAGAAASSIRIGAVRGGTPTLAAKASSELRERTLWLPRAGQ